MATRIAIICASILLLNPNAVLAQDVKIGIIEPLSGQAAFDGNAVLKGAKLAQQEINAAGGVLGARLEFVVADGACNAADTVSAAEKLINADHVPVIEGAFCSGATQAIMPIVEKLNVPLVSGVASLDKLTKAGNKWFFRTTEADSMEAVAFADVLHSDLKFKTVFYFGTNDDFGRGIVDFFKTRMEALGAKTVGTEFYDTNSTDLYTPLTKIRALKPDLLFVTAFTQAAASIAKQSVELGLSSKIFGIGAWTTPAFLKLAGSASDGILAGVPYAPSASGELNEKFVKAFQAANGELPSKYAAGGYNATHIIAQAIQRAGSLDSTKIRDALYATDYNGPTGRIRMASNGQAYGFNLFLIELEKGDVKIRAQRAIDKLE